MPRPWWGNRTPFQFLSSIAATVPNVTFRLVTRVRLPASNWLSKGVYFTARMS